MANQNICDLWKPREILLRRYTLKRSITYFAEDGYLLSDL